MSTYKTYPNTPAFNETPNGVLTTFTFDEACVTGTLTVLQGSLPWTDYTYTNPTTLEFGTAPPAASGAGDLYILSGWFGAETPAWNPPDGNYYCDLGDLQDRKGNDRLIDWADDDGDDVPDDTVINAVIAWAYHEINAELMERYEDYLPFTSATLPGVIHNIAVTFAIYLLCQREKDLYTSQKAYSKEYDEARARLHKIAAGEIALQLADGTTLTSLSGRHAGKISDTRTPIYSRTTMYPMAERWY
jgi:phage gp36-like protein